MFEKEAEKWTIDYVCKDCSRYKECKSKEHCTCKNCSKEKWQNGAEFGYNKANEWHFVKDVEYPTHSNRVLVLTDEGVGFGIYGLDNQKWYTYDTGFDVIACKEITLPALPNEVKEND